MAQSGESEDHEDFQCPLCHELLYEPCVPSCGHPFCRECLRQLIRHSAGQNQGAKCPVCRRVLHVTRASDLLVCHHLDLLLAKTFPVEYTRRKESKVESAEPMETDASSSRSHLPIFVLDPTLPGQHLYLNIFEPRYIIMIRRALEGGSRHFGMSEALGASRGVEVQIVNAAEQWDGRFHVEIVGRRPFQIISSSYAPEGFLEADVEYFDFEAGDEEDAAAAQAAADLPALVDTWEMTVRSGGWQRQHNHLAKVREHLGPMPPISQPGTLAAWVVAFVNPIPPLGVAPEMRPALLEAQGPLARVTVARTCLNASLAHLESIERSWLRRVFSFVPSRYRKYAPTLLIVVSAVVMSRAYSSVQEGEGVADLLAGVMSTGLSSLSPA